MKIDLLTVLETKECGWESRKAERIKQEKQFDSFTGKITVMELHIPYLRLDLANQVLNDDLDNPSSKKMLVLNGDYLNLDTLSYFYKISDNPSMPLFEIKQLIKFLKEASKVYDHIVMIESNHDSRSVKFIHKLNIQEAQKRGLLELMLDFKKMIENEVNKVTYVSNFFFQVGDVVFSHYSENGKIEETVSRKMIAQFRRLEKPWTICFHGHTHQQNILSVNRKIVVQPGALCKVQDYARTDKAWSADKLTSYGNGYCYMKKGKADTTNFGIQVRDWEEGL